MRTVALLSILLVACSRESKQTPVARPEPPDSGSAEVTTTPEQFQGRWAGRAADCGRPAESSLAITADSVNFYASRGRVLAVDVMKDREIEVLLESAGEGQVWRQTRRFKLSEDGQSLTDLTTEGRVVRGRCTV